MANSGCFVVFEGIDGAGCETQSKLFLSHARHAFGKNKVLYLDYPEYKSCYGKLLKNFLHGKLKISRKEAFLLFFLDQLKDAEKIKTALSEKKIVISNRYFTSNIAYHFDLFDVEDMIKLAEFFSLPKPDIIFYIDISPKESIRRKSLEKKGKLDINEKNLTKLISIRQAYYKLALNHAWIHNWIIVDGQRSKKEIAEDIWNTFLKADLLDF
ncbi:MAG: dTMP kinase [Candidatus Nanoarchaeia archaeon]